MDFGLVRKGLAIGILASTFLFIGGSLLVSVAGGIFAAARNYSRTRLATLGASIVIGVTIPVAWTWFWIIGIPGTAAFALFFGGWFVASWLATWLVKNIWFK